MVNQWSALKCRPHDNHLAFGTFRLTALRSCILIFKLNVYVCKRKTLNLSLVMEANNILTLVLEIWEMDWRHHWWQAPNNQWQVDLRPLQRPNRVLACFDGESLRQVCAPNLRNTLYRLVCLNQFKSSMPGFVARTRTWMLELLQRLWWTSQVGCTCACSSPIHLQTCGSWCAELDDQSHWWAVALHKGWAQLQYYFLLWMHMWIS